MCTRGCACALPWVTGRRERSMPTQCSTFCPMGASIQIISRVPTHENTGIAPSQVPITPSMRPLNRSNLKNASKHSIIISAACIKSLKALAYEGKKVHEQSRCRSTAQPNGCIDFHRQMPSLAASHRRLAKLLHSRSTVVLALICLVHTHFS